MLLDSSIWLPILGIITVLSVNYYEPELTVRSEFYPKLIALSVSITNLVISLWIFIFFHNSSNQFQYVEQHYNIQIFDIYLGLDNISIYFFQVSSSRCHIPNT